MAENAALHPTTEASELICADNWLILCSDREHYAMVIEKLRSHSRADPSYLFALSDRCGPSLELDRFWTITSSNSPTSLHNAAAAKTFPSGKVFR